MLATTNRIEKETSDILYSRCSRWFSLFKQILKSSAFRMVLTVKKYHANISSHTHNNVLKSRDIEKEMDVLFMEHNLSFGSV